MTPGLVNSVVMAEITPRLNRAVVQIMLIDDDARRIADLEARLRESEEAYDRLCNDNAALDEANRHLLHENKCKDIRIQQMEAAHAAILRRL